MSKTFGKNREVSSVLSSRGLHARLFATASFAVRWEDRFGSRWIGDSDGIIREFFSPIASLRYPVRRSLWIKVDRRQRCNYSRAFLLRSGDFDVRLKDRFGLRRIGDSDARGIIRELLFFISRVFRLLKRSLWIK